VLGVGDPIPNATVWQAPREPVELQALVSESTSLFLFYLFDWSAT
jgi:hypothetical protein